LRIALSGDHELKNDWAIQHGRASVEAMNMADMAGGTLESLTAGKGRGGHRPPPSADERNLVIASAAEEGAGAGK